ncbi:Basic-leucine zipper domain-containing protein [Cynara cardunculus var. scolymus]|uniref:Basic-leucine zipper domain-containing protein n=1 Tax=Cynara cardunculus var. scolymus TaxID=59895 RepID=A0A103YDS4_CYNCS|nr:Basic-leucine zipper domain-containing protein [Cynara cardunculus var. scolymus]
MTSTSTQFATSRRMGIYDPLQQISMWEEAFGASLSPNTSPNMVISQTEYNSQESLGPSLDNRATKNISDKLQRRLAQNREAARKSRLRKKGVYGGLLNTGNGLLSGNVTNSGIAAFEMEYDLWVAEQQKKDDELRKVLLTHMSDIELRIFVDSGLNHYYELFRMKADAAKADVFYLMNGLWRTPVERFFQWIGGFRPSELLYIELLTDAQLVNVTSLRQSCEQAEEALSQGMDKLQQTLAQSITIDITGAGSYNSQMTCAMERLEALEIFLNQADHLRQQTLQQMYRLLTTRQAARVLLALGEYFQRLRVLSSLWSARPHDHSTTLLP